MKSIYTLIAVASLMLVSCNEETQTKSESPHPRYAAQTFVVGGGLAVVTQITDNETGKLFLYKYSDKDGLKLENVIDLNKCGAETIPFEIQE
jgi:hypothetical protein